MIQSVVKALRLLELLNQREALSLVELAELTQMKVPTTHNLLTTLESQGFLQRDTETRRYRLGPAALSLGKSQTNLDLLIEMATPYLKSLSEEIGETVILTALHHQKRQTLISFESKELLRVSVKPGSDTHFTNTATGHILLSMLPEKQQKELLSGLSQDEQHPFKMDAFQLTLDKIRTQGYENFRPNLHIRALAVPLNLTNGIVSSIGVCYPDARHTFKESALFIQSMIQTAQAITTKQGELK